MKTNRALSEETAIFANYSEPERMRNRHTIFTLLVVVGLFVFFGSCKDKVSGDPVYGSLPGQYLPNFSIADEQGSAITNDVLAGKISLVVFWASWCSYCNNEIDGLNDIFRDFKDKNVVVLGVSLDTSKEAWINKVDQREMQYMQVNDANGFSAEFAVACNVNTIPKMLITDGNGKVLYITTKAENARNYLNSIAY